MDNQLPTNTIGIEENEEDQFEREADELLAKIKNRQEQFSQRSQELVSQLTTETNLLQADAKTIEGQITQIEKEGQSELQAATDKFIAETDKVGDE